MTLTTTDTHIINVTDQNFAREVIERSHNLPVVVDFWAEWCGPCRMLGPILEKLADEYQGAFVLAKLDVDSHQATAVKYRVQGIPAVKAFVDGQVAGEFTGALPEPQVRQFVEGLFPSRADLYAKQAFEWEMNNQLSMAITNYQAALEEQSDHYPALVGLGRTLLKQGQVEEGLSTLDKVPAGVRERPVAEALMATAQFQQYANGHKEPELRARITTNPDDLESRYALANLLAAEERYIEALDEFLEVVRRDRSYQDDGARKAMLALFTIIGENQKLTREYRRKLANLLF